MRTHRVLFTVILLGILPGCKKYPEGGTHGNARRAFRAENTTCWDLSLYQVNDIDSTAFVVGSGDRSKLEGAFCFFEQRYSHYYSLFDRKNRSLAIGENFEHLIFTTDSVGKTTIGGEVFRMVVAPERPGMIWEIRKFHGGEIILETQGMNRYRLIFVKRK